MLIQNNKVSLRVEESLLYCTAWSKALTIHNMKQSDLSIDLKMVQSYKVTKNWFFGYRLEFLMEVHGQSNHYILPLPGLSKKELKALINTINKEMGPD